MNNNALNTPIDLNQLLVRESAPRRRCRRPPRGMRKLGAARRFLMSEQVEWKENVADPDDLIASLCAFANDVSNLGGGYVICGAKEVKDAYGFPAVEVKGLRG